MDALWNPYEVRDGIVTWRGRPVPRADPATFHWLGGDWARDAHAVYIQTSASRTVDPATFVLLNPVYGRDANTVFDCKGSIRGADPTTFEALDSGRIADETIATQVWVRGYGRDRVAVYYHDQASGRATVVRGAQPATFVSLRNDYGFDVRGVWYQKTRLPQADPTSWVYLGRLWSCDRERFYFADHEVPGIVRERFTVVRAPTAGNYATDGTRFFDSGRETSEQQFWSGIVGDFQSSRT